MKKLFLILIVLIMSGCVAKENSELVALEKQLQTLQNSISQNNESIASLQAELATLESPQLIPITEQFADQLVNADVFYWTNAHEIQNQKFITYDAASDTTTIQFLRVNLKMIIEGRIPEYIMVSRDGFRIDFGYQTSETIDGIASYFIMSNIWGFQEITGKRSIVSGHDMDSILDETQQAQADEFLRRKTSFVEGN
jgi:hypothetical protein